MKPNAITHEDVAGEASVRRHSVRTYRTLAKAFHWLTAVLVLMQVASGVIMKQLGEGALADMLLSLHKLTGALTLTVVIVRLSYRVLGIEPKGTTASYRHPFVHWVLYAVIIAVPLLGWAGVSDMADRGILFGYSLPEIWPEGAGYGELLLSVHAYLAFALLAFVALHIGNALQDYMTRSDG
jgi:cytochrome b561